jgi:hypothetical protein
VHLETLSGFTRSPDGRVLAFSDVGTGTNVGPLSKIELINADGSGLRTLDPQARRPGWVQAHVPGQTDPLWSPSGRAIGYTRVSGPTNGTRPFQTNVWLADLSAPA